MSKSNNPYLGYPERLRRENPQDPMLYSEDIKGAPIVVENMTELYALAPFFECLEEDLTIVTVRDSDGNGTKARFELVNKADVTGAGEDAVFNETAFIPYEVGGSGSIAIYDHEKTYKAENLVLYSSDGTNQNYWIFMALVSDLTGVFPGSDDTKWRLVNKVSFYELEGNPTDNAALAAAFVQKTTPIGEIQHMTGDFDFDGTIEFFGPLYIYNAGATLFQALDIESDRIKLNGYNIHESGGYMQVVRNNATGQLEIIENPVFTPTAPPAWLEAVLTDGKATIPQALDTIVSQVEQNRVSLATADNDQKSLKLFKKAYFSR